MRFIRTALRAWRGRQRGKEGGREGEDGGAFLRCFTAAVTAAAETGVCLYSGRRGQDKCYSHMVQTGHTWPHSDLTPSWAARDFIKRALSGSGVSQVLSRQFNTDSPRLWVILAQGYFASSLLINVKTLSRPALSAGTPDELHHGGSPPWCIHFDSWSPHLSEER